jgi:hypothetical protein
MNSNLAFLSDCVFDKLIAKSRKWDLPEEQDRLSRIAEL